MARMTTYEIMDRGRPIRRRFADLESAMEWGELLGSRSLIPISRDGVPIGKKIWNPQTGKSKVRK